MAALRHFVPMEDPTYDQIHDRLCEGYPNACMLWLEKIENPELASRYLKYVTKRQDETPGLFQEVKLFHGTKEGNAYKIAQDGFKAALNTRSAYGHGTYFATRADVSKLYAPRSQTDCNFMILAKVCVNVHGHEKTPGIYVMEDDDAILPQYIIAFYANAK